VICLFDICLKCNILGLFQSYYETPYLRQFAIKIRRYCLHHLKSRNTE